MKIEATVIRAQEQYPIVRLSDDWMIRNKLKIHSGVIMIYKTDGGIVLYPLDSKKGKQLCKSIERYVKKKFDIDAKVNVFSILDLDLSEENLK